MTTLDRLYLMLLDGVISKEAYERAVIAYKQIPEIERSRYDN